MRSSLAGLWTLTVVIAGCTGAVDGPIGSAALPALPSNGGAGAPASNPGGPPAVGSPRDPVTIPPIASCTGSKPDVGASAVRFLTRTEYERTVRDLLRMPTVTVPALPPDGRFEYATANVDVSITESSSDLYMRAAADIARQALPSLPALLACPEGAGESCARQFIETFGTRAFRRPPTAAQVDGLMKVFRMGTGRGSFSDGITLVLQAMLQSGSFLYRVDRAEASAGEVRQVDGYTIASRLSYLLWSSMPDDALLTAAAKNELRTVEQIAAQLGRMMNDPRTRDGFLEFFRRWLGLHALSTTEKDSKTFPQWGPALKASMAMEAEALLGQVMWSGDGRLATLLTTRDATLDGPVAALYGVGIAKGPTKLDANRPGVMTRAAFLATASTETETNPVHLGLFVRERLLCGTVAPPTVMVEPPAPSSAKTARERFAEHSASPACTPCHALMDPLGLAFETYDAIGRHRTTENGRPIDTSGELVGAGDASGRFAGAVELIELLARSQEVRSCLTRQWFRYTMARAESPQDACTLAAMESAVRGAGDDLRGLLKALATTEAFRHVRR